MPTNELSFMHVFMSRRDVRFRGGITCLCGKGEYKTERVYDDVFMFHTDDDDAGTARPEPYGIFPPSVRFRIRETVPIVFTEANPV